MAQTKSEQCEKMVRGEGQWGSFHQHQCRNKAKVCRDGKWYCGVHDPVKRAEKEKIRSERWEKERVASKEKRRRRNAEIAYCEGISTENLEAFKRK